MNIQFSPTTRDNLIDIINHWLETLNSVQDDMWESFMDQSHHWSIRNDEEIIGYACINQENQLLQFYILPEHQNFGEIILSKLLSKKGIKDAMVCTNNPFFLHTALTLNTQVKSHSYLFSNPIHVSIPKRDWEMNQTNKNDLERVINFCHYSMGAPKSWLEQYLSNLIQRGELYIFEKDEIIMGTIEVRIRDHYPLSASLGMIVSPDFRGKGIGTYLLGQAKEMAIKMGKSPICSCELENMASLKAIHKNGFRSTDQMLKITF